MDGNVLPPLCILTFTLPWSIHKRLYPGSCCPNIAQLRFVWRLTSKTSKSAFLPILVLYPCAPLLSNEMGIKERQRIVHERKT